MKSWTLLSDWTTNIKRISRKEEESRKKEEAEISLKVLLPGKSGITSVPKERIMILTDYNSLNKIGIYEHMEI